MSYTVLHVISYSQITLFDIHLQLYFSKIPGNDSDACNYWLACHLFEHVRRPHIYISIITISMMQGICLDLSHHPLLLRMAVRLLSQVKVETRLMIISHLKL